MTRVIWDRESIIERIQAWAELYGDQPSMRDWNPSLARIQGRDDIARRFEVDGCWPWFTAVRKLFGTWNAAIAEAGFTPLGPGRPKGSHAAEAEPLALVDEA